MRLMIWTSLISLVFLPGFATAQSVDATDIPGGSRIDFDTSEGGFKGVVLAVGADSVRIAMENDSDAPSVVEFPITAIRSMRIEESSPFWTLTARGPAKWELSAEEDGEGPSQARIYLVTEEEIAALDAYSGESLWRVPSSPYLDGELDRLMEIKGLTGEPLVLLLLESNDDRARLIGLNSETGDIEWELNEVFTQPPSDLNSAPIVPLPEMGKLFVYFNRDGPLLVDPSNGSVIWHSKALYGRPVQDPGRGAAVPVADHSAVYVPTQRGVSALDIADGARRWEVWNDDSFMPSRLHITPWGLVVVGRDIDHAGATGRLQFSLLDTADGSVLWDLKPEEGARAAIRSDSIFVAGLGTLQVIDIPSGEARTLTQWRPPSDASKFRMALEGFSMDQRGFYLGWSFGSITLNADGRERSRIKLAPPGATLGEALTAGIVGFPFSRRIGAGRPGSWYVFTGEPIRPEITGFNLARIDQREGTISGRVWIDERKPAYWIIPGLTVLVRGSEEEQTIAAYPFTGCEPLIVAAAAGSRTLLDTLMARGVRPGQTSSAGCQPVLVAARAGNTSMVEDLLARGWSQDESSREGWTALHFAASKGNAELADILLNAGSSAAVPTRGRYPWTPLLLAVQGGHDPVVALLEERGAVEEESRLSLMRSWSNLIDGALEDAVAERVATLGVVAEPRYPPRYRALFCYQSSRTGMESPWPDDCDQEVSDYGDDPFSHLARGYAKALAEDLPGAEEDFRECARQDPFDELAATCLFAAEEVARGSAPEPLQQHTLNLSGPMPE